MTSLLDPRRTAHERRCGTSAFLSYQCTLEIWHNVCIKKQDSGRSMRQKWIEHSETHWTQMFKESPAIVEGPRWTNERHEITERLLESWHCVVSSMGLRNKMKTFKHANVKKKVFIYRIFSNEFLFLNTHVSIIWKCLWLSFRHLVKCINLFPVSNKTYTPHLQGLVLTASINRLY